MILIEGKIDEKRVTFLLDTAPTTPSSA